MMPQWLSDGLSNGWTYTIGGTVVAAAVAGLWAPLRRLLAKAISRGWNRWFRGLRLTRDPKPEPVPEFVADPRWDIRIREDDPEIYGLKNLGGVALHVRIRAEDDEVVLVGTVDFERVEAGAIVPFGIPRLQMDGITSTWIQVTCKNSAAQDLPLARVRIPGMLDR
jgi:hypothetical protein